MAITLYALPLSPNTRKVRAVLLELEIPHELKIVDTRAGDQRKAEYLRLNPNGKMPTLVDGDFVLWESNAILRYLASIAGRLLPQEARGAALVDQWLYWQSAHFGPAVGKVAYERVLKPMFGMDSPDEAVVLAGTKEFQPLARVLDTCLADRPFVATELSIADFALAASADFAQRAELPLKAYPNVQAWFERMSALDSFQRSAPAL